MGFMDRTKQYPTKRKPAYTDSRQPHDQKGAAQAVKKAAQSASRNKK